MGRIGIIIVVLALAGCSSRVAGGLDEMRANEAMTWLEDHGIAASKAVESGSGEARFAIEVPRGDLGEALSLLHASGLPRQDDPGIAETYAESSLVPSPAEERARHEAAIAGELARTLERIDGVVDARVHLAVPERDALRLDDAPSPARASVLLSTRGPVAADDDAIAALVAGAVDELSPGAVSVVTVPARGVARSPRLAHLGPFRVAPSSVRPLAWLLGVSLGIHVAMAALYLALSRRRTRVSPALEITADA